MEAQADLVLSGIQNILTVSSSDTYIAQMHWPKNKKIYNSYLSHPYKQKVGATVESNSKVSMQIFTD